MDHSNIFKPKMFDSRREEKVREEKRHRLHTQEMFQQPVHHKRPPNPRPGHTEQNGSKAPVVVSSQRRERLVNGDVNGSRHPRSYLDGLPDGLPDEQRRLAKAIHEKRVLLQEKLRRLEHTLRTLQDKESSETWRRERGRRSDVDMRTEGSVGNPHEGKRDDCNREKVLPRRPGRAEETGHHGTRPSGHLNRRDVEAMEVKELNSDKERSKRSVHLSAKTRGESQWSQARANEEEEQRRHTLSKEKAPGKRWERSSMGRHGSSGEEGERVGQQRSHRQVTEHHRGQERPHLPQSSRPQAADPIPEETTDASLQRLSCKYCERRFAAARLEEHLTICERLHQSQRKKYDSFKHRIQGTELEKFRRKSGMSLTSEEKNSTGKQKQGSNRNMHQVGQSVQSIPVQVTCPHCSRRFAPQPAERHIPMCQNIRSRPPPPRHRQ